MDKKRFSYELYEKNRYASHEELTKLSAIILDTKTGVFSVIVNTLRIVAILALFKIRQNMMSEEMAAGKQIYEQRRRKDAEKDLEDSLDG